MLIIQWPTILAAFLAALVEFVEALTIVLAVGAVRGWRPAIAGAVVAAALLAVLVAAFGPHLARLDAHIFQIVVGLMLLLFGLRWLRKAILRAAGMIALHNEEKEYAEAEEALRGGTVGAGFDTGGALAAFNGVFIEGIEVVFIVITMGAASHQILPAVFGASAAAVLVVLLGLIARKPLSLVPENALKLIVGALISAFGILLTGEGLGLSWAGGVWTPLLLSLGYFIVAALGYTLARSVQRGVRV
ncbi:MAG: hypothetical protein ACRYFS_22370 [Janthinobacterium lividum]